MAAKDFESQVMKLPCSREEQKRKCSSTLEAGDRSARTSCVYVSLWLSFLRCLTLSRCWAEAFFVGLWFTLLVQEPWRNLLALPLVISLWPCCEKKHGVIPTSLIPNLVLGVTHSRAPSLLQYIERAVKATFFPSCTIFSSFKNCACCGNAQYIFFLL